MRCDACLADSSCTAITDLGDGNAECAQLGASGGRGDFLICVNLALAIDAVATCTQGRAPSCPRDTHASESISSLERNARFLDDAACGGPLDTCLATIYGASQGGFPGPGSDAGTGAPPRNTSIDCSDSFREDPNCEASPSCELDGPSCDDSTASDGGCSDSNQQSGCDSGGGSGDGCSSDSGSSCDSGGDCSSDSSGDCGGGGGDCGGGGGDCSGGGGDCGGGGGDCNAAARHGRSAGGALPIAVIWAFLPVPFAVRVRQRAVRKRAQAEYEAQDPEAPS